MKLALFASHNGSVLEPLLEAIKERELSLELSLIISNNTHAAVLTKAKKYAITHALINTKTTQNPDQKLYELLQEHKIEIILLAGYMKKLPALITENFFVINSHPALLPKYGGKGMYGRFVHEAVIQNAEQESGVTIHCVNEEYDKGAIILQKKLSLAEDETVQTLEQKIKELEKSALIEALKLCLK